MEANNKQPELQSEDKCANKRLLSVIAIQGAPPQNKLVANQNTAAIQMVPFYQEHHEWEIANIQYKLAEVGADKQAINDYRARQINRVCKFCNTIRSVEIEQ